MSCSGCKVRSMAVAATSPMLTRFDAPHCEVALELIDDHYPLLLVRWSGQLEPQHILQMIRFFDEYGEQAASEGKHLVHICDARDAALPNPLVRDMLIDWLADRPQDRPSRGTQSLVVASDPMIRGVVASLKWATGRGDSIRVMSKIEQAIVEARELFVRAGLEIPEVIANAAA